MLPSVWTYATALAALTSTAYSNPTSKAVSRSDSSTACNNSPDLCNRSYSNITHMGAHDSAFLRDASTDNSIAGNQFYNATVALDAGIRLLQAQVHNENGTIELCHTLCSLLDAGPLENWLADISSWMGNNPNEVVTLLIVNSDNQEISAFGSVFESSGLSKYGYTPSGNGDWPTLQEMISNNTRLVTFIASVTASSSYPYLLSEFDYVFETTFGVTSADGFNCTLQRPSTEASAAAAIQAGLLPLINHFRDDALTSSITVPDVDDIATTNSPETNTTGALGLQTQNCREQWGVIPTFILVDFWNEGPAIDTADVMNDVTDAVGRKNDTATTSSGSTTTPSQGTSHSGRSTSGMGTGALVAFIVAADISRKMDYTKTPTPEHCYADFCLVPVGTASLSMAEEIAEVQKLLKASGLDYTMHSAGTTVEGSWDDVFKVIGQAHTVVHARGVVRVQTSMRVGTRTDKKQTAEDKVKRVEDILGNPA
ncbi:PLC-like phosphodiesterase [Xylariaceae sp. FL0255]|nr:PLC-like phosphodiesterase [Xylariaceae sp. FL0255]